MTESASRRPTLALGMSKPIPKVNLFKLLVKKLVRQGNLALLMAELHEQYGSVFAFKAPFTDMGITVLAGAETNSWMN